MTPISEPEVAVVEAILGATGDPRARRLTDQFKKEGRLRRSLWGSTLEVRVESTTEDLLVDLDSHVDSRPVRVRDHQTGQALTFTVSLLPGGFFGVLRGESDGPWPRRWAVQPDELASAAQGALRFPNAEPADPHGLLSVLELDAEDLNDVAPRSGADAEEMDALQAQGSLPHGVREVLLASDGFRVRDVEVLGNADLYVIDFGDGVTWWLVGQQADGEQHFVCSEKAVASVPEPRADPEILELLGPSYLNWVKGLLRRS